MAGEQVSVRIFGETYTLRSGEDAAYVEEIARHVDARMREAAASGKVVATAKIAVLAALHIADELYRLRRDAARGREEAEHRIAGLVDRLDRALAADDAARAAGG